MSKMEIFKSGYSLNIPSKLIDFLMEDDFQHSKKKRTSKLKAFINIAEETFISLVKGLDGTLPMYEVSERWNWSRPTIIRFFKNLEDKNAVKILYSGTTRFFRLSREIFILSEDFASCGHLPVQDGESAIAPSKILFSAKTAEGVAEATSKDNPAKAEPKAAANAADSADD